MNLRRDSWCDFVGGVVCVCFCLLSADFKIPLPQAFHVSQAAPHCYFYGVGVKACFIVQERKREKNYCFVLVDCIGKHYFGC